MPQLRVSNLKSVSEEDNDGEDNIFESNSLGIMHSDRESNGVTHSDCGITHSDHESNGITQSDHESNGVTHSDHESNGITHIDPESTGVPHSDHDTHDTEGLREQEYKHSNLETQEQGTDQKNPMLEVGGKESADLDGTVTDANMQLVGENGQLEPGDVVATESTRKDHETDPDQRSPDTDETHQKLSTQPKLSSMTEDLRVGSSHSVEYHQSKPSGAHSPHPDQVHAKVSTKSSVDSGFVSTVTTLRSDADSMTSDHSQSADLKLQQPSHHFGRQSEDTTAGGCGIVVTKAGRHLSTPGVSEQLNDFGGDFAEDAGALQSRPGFHRSHSIDSKLRVAADVNSLGFSRNQQLRSSGPQLRTGSEDSLTR